MNDIQDINELHDMKDYADRFSMLEELPVSEEMIGAWLEGNLSGEEESFVEEQLDSSNLLSEIVNDDTDIFQESFSEFPYDDFDNLVLPDAEAYIGSQRDADIIGIDYMGSEDDNIYIATQSEMDDHFEIRNEVDVIPFDEMPANIMPANIIDVEDEVVLADSIEIRDLSEEELASIDQDSIVEIDLDESEWSDNYDELSSSDIDLLI